MGLVYIHKSKSRDRSRTGKDFRIARVNRLAVSTIIAGAIGNLIDRLWLGYVVDFLTLGLYGRMYLTLQTYWL